MIQSRQAKNRLDYWTQGLMLCLEAGYSGVPQGSVLSGIFVNDLEEETGCSTIRSVD